MFDLTGKVAVITGSSRGIGRAIAEALADAGAKVVVSSRKLDACEPVAGAIREKGHDAAAIACHIGRREDCENLIQRSREKFGKIDVLVCNAAVNPYYGPMTGLSDEAFDKTMSSNVRSNLWLANLVQPEMAARRDGVIIIVSSIGGLKGTDMLGIYAISKAADMQLARNLAVEWGPQNIRVNCIAPGLVRTEFARALWEDPEMRHASEARMPLGRIGEPDDIAGAAVFLAARSGNWITGQTIVIDGGRTIV
ncbi:MAG TPA: SDR family oxidoreductase [Bryobacteraceae bacterium]|nr:SDR family oxidoreductase [Bryobacteraceae bacterium]